MKTKLNILSNWGVYKPELVTHWTTHYKNMGADEILILLHSSNGDDERFQLMCELFLKEGITNIVPWYGKFNDIYRTKKYNFELIPNIFRNDDDNWVMCVDDDELFEYPCELTKTKDYLTGICDIFKRPKVFFKGNTIHRVRCNIELPPGNPGQPTLVPYKLNNDMSIYDQFPCKDKRLPGRDKNGHRIARTKILGFNFQCSLKTGQHSINGVRNHDRWRYNNSNDLDGHRVCYHGKNLAECILDDNAFEYKDYTLEDWRKYER